MTDYPISDICMQIPIWFTDIFTNRKAENLGQSFILFSLNVFSAGADNVPNMHVILAFLKSINWWIHISTGNLVDNLACQNLRIFCNGEMLSMSSIPAFPQPKKHRAGATQILQCRATPFYLWMSCVHYDIIGNGFNKYINWQSGWRGPILADSISNLIIGANLLRVYSGSERVPQHLLC